jgi:cysteine desulfurase
MHGRIIEPVKRTSPGRLATIVVFGSECSSGDCPGLQNRWNVVHRRSVGSIPIRSRFGVFMERVYFDYNATTPLAPEVASAMRPFLEEEYGNPSCLHWAGQRAHAAVEQARRQVAMLLHCEPAEIVFTSGGTEANNSALTGVFFKSRENTSPHFVISSVEHPSISNVASFLERLGSEVTRVPVDRFGQVDPESVRRAMRPNTALVSVMHANNEVGTIQPIREIAAIAREHNVLIHTDAAQTVGKVPVNVQELGVDLLTVAGHKTYAPQGVGALFVRKGVSLEPYLHGAAHESGRRAGTENVLEIVALGAACELVNSKIDVPAMRKLRDDLWQLLSERFGDRVVLNGHPEERLPNTLNVNFVGCRGHEILFRVAGLAASTGSACHEDAHKLSPVLRAMGVPESVGLGAIRFSLGRNSTANEVEWVVDQVADAIAF